MGGAEPGMRERMSNFGLVMSGGVLEEHNSMVVGGYEQNVLATDSNETMLMKRRLGMVKNVNIFKFVLYILFICSMLVNAVQIYADIRTTNNQTFILAIFIITMFMLVVVPTYYVAAIKWLHK